MKYLKQYALLTLVILLNITTLSAKSLNPGRKGGHEADIYSVLPFERCTEISELILLIHNNIDHPIGYFPGLRDAPHQDFTWRKHGHRVFFHWGYNANPQSSPILQELVAERNWTAAVQQSFWKKVVDEQARRNRESMATVGSTLGFQTSGAQRAYANAFASIITDIHLLGDYSTTNIVTLQNIDLIIADIKKALFESLRGGDDAKRINKLLDDTAKIEDVRLRAETALGILQREFPAFILKAQNGFFARHFEKKSLPLKKL